jgi:hypothetical protein
LRRGYCRSARLIFAGNAFTSRHFQRTLSVLVVAILQAASTECASVIDGMNTGTLAGMSTRRHLRKQAWLSVSSAVISDLKPIGSFDSTVSRLILLEVGNMVLITCFGLDL